MPDQLRISQGWVRCGHCTEIFDAAQQLDGPAADTSATDPAQPAALAPQPVPPSQAEQPQAAETWPDTELLPPQAGQDVPPAIEDDAPQWLPHAPAEIPVTDSVASLDMELADYAQAQAGTPVADAEPAPPTSWVPDLQRASAEGAAAPGEVPERLVITLAAESVPVPLRAASGADAMPLPQRPAAEAPRPAPAPPRVVAAAPVPRPVPPDPAHAELSFLREAEPAAPAPASGAALRARVLWSAAVGLALAALLWQLAVHERDRLAASAPGLRPLLDGLCAPLGCSVQPLRRIDAIVIDGSSFQMLGDSGYRLSLTLRNRAAHPVALPAIALALTDISEQAVVRRVLMPQDLGTPPAALEPHGEWTASVDLQMAENAGRARVVGYRVDPFYP
ncbi:DUF3426 domain-containing protein [Pseudorhodoferax sp.]|uniref:zinc-ribbon and DUF3426 domain-containing protein n=1 Tax=Pseudorhodoferax sp. TaxID=1993553 RepID=UPI003FA6CF44